MKKIIVPILLASVLAACNNDNGNLNANVVQTGNFIDSAVKGLIYTTATQEGATDAAGTFYYQAGEEVEFLLGEMFLGKAIGADILYPQNINVDHELDIARLLLTLDADANADNGIDVSHIRKDLTAGLLISAVDQNMVNYLREGDASRTLKTAAEAREHLTQNQDFDNAISVADGQLTVSTTFSQAMLDAGNSHLSAYMALKDSSKAIVFGGQNAESMSAEITFNAQYAQGDTGQTNENGRNNGTRTRLRSGLYLYMHNSETGHSLYFFNRIEKDRGDNHNRLIYKAFVEHHDGQGESQEVVYNDIDAYACETSEGKVENQTLSIEKAVIKNDQNEDSDAVIITCGSHQLAKVFIDDVLENHFGVDASIGSFIINAIGTEVKQKTPAVGSVINPSFDNIKINGQLADSFSNGKINRDVWTYTRLKRY